MSPALAQLAFVAALLAGGTAHPEEQKRPFEAGEVLAYEARLGRFGSPGTGFLKVASDEPVRGEPVVRLQFDIAAKFGPFSVQHASRSWLSTQRMAALRYHVSERAPTGDVREEFDLYPEAKRWIGRRGAGESTTAEPLDELSYIYLLRTLPLAQGEKQELSRHFDPRRNPASFEVLGRRKVTVPAGAFDTLIVELRVIDPTRFGGRGTLRLYLSDDARRVPVRIESEVPFVGQLTLELLPLKES